MDPTNLDPPCLGLLLIEFFYYFGIEIDLSNKEMEVRKPEGFVEDFSNPNQVYLTEEKNLILIDPLKRHINVGKGVRVQKLKVVFIGKIELCIFFFCLELFFNGLFCASFEVAESNV